MVRELTFTEQREIAEITARLECLADLEALVKLADDKTLTHAQKHHVLQTVIIKMERLETWATDLQSLQEGKVRELVLDSPPGNLFRLNPQPHFIVVRRRQ